ncbi:putative EG45-like domain containing protein 1 [Bidens hawaiensis]|uniref:putative EG45-like domain containing protein 1 n=1 Tax=Bidens hawaiensis TaxID=980011 RepID=UPI00404B23F5
MVCAAPGTATFYRKYTHKLLIVHRGRGASYKGAPASACYGNTPKGVMIAAASDTLWNNGAICGKVFTVKCTGHTNAVPHPCYNGKHVTVKIVDHCPHCGGTLDLSAEAFAAIANSVA